MLVADDETATRAGLRQVIEPHGLMVVAEASNADEAVHAALVHRPDVCLVTVRIPGSGIEAAHRIRDALPETKIIMLMSSEHDDDLFAALRVGADGYLLKASSSERLPQAIEGVLHGEAALPRVLTAQLIREFRDRGRGHWLPTSVSGEGVQLTEREFEVLTQLGQGKSTCEIATELGISDVTVRRHISALLRKLGVSDRQSAVRLLEGAGQPNAGS